MTAVERDELVYDLERAGVYVESVGPIEPAAYHPGEWQVLAWCPDPAHYHLYGYFITDAARFRRSVRDGLIPDLPRRALD